MGAFCTRGSSSGSVTPQRGLEPITGFLNISPRSLCPFRSLPARRSTARDVARLARSPPWPLELEWPSAFRLASVSRSIELIRRHRGSHSSRTTGYICYRISSSPAPTVPAPACERRWWKAQGQPQPHPPCGGRCETFSKSGPRKFPPGAAIQQNQA